MRVVKRKSGNRRRKERERAKLEAQKQQGILETKTW
jgi:hypothetical protein